MRIRVEALPLLTRDEEIALGKRAMKGCSKSQGKLVLHNIPLIVSIAGEFMWVQPMYHDDLCSEALVGAMKASKKYDPSRGKFSVCLRYYVTGEIRKRLGKIINVIERPEWVAHSIGKIEKTAIILKNMLGREASDLEIGAEIGLSEYRVGRIRKTNQPVARLDRKIDSGGDGNAVLRDLIPDENATRPDTEADSSSVREWNQALMDILDPRARFIVSSRFGSGASR